MSIPVGCQCGKRFQAKDELAGKRVKCPGCGNVLTIPSPEPAVTGGIDDLFGAGDPLFASGPAAPAGFGPPAGMPPAGPPRPRKKKGPNVVLIAGIAGGGVGLLLILVVVVMLVVGGKKPDEQVAVVTPVSPTPTADPVTATTPTAPAAPTTAAPPPPVTPPVANPIPTTPTPSPQPTSTPEVLHSESDGSGNSVEVTSNNLSGDASSRTALPTALANWHAKAEGKFSGAIRPEDDKDDHDVISYQYSWMTQLMPYLGYQRIYKRFDFKKPWTEGENYAAGQYRIPQFLNPADDRKSWDGYQFPNLALTHFVGMAGVEDTRQEVAAAFDRSDPRAGIFGYTAVAKESEITDGKGQTIMLIGSGEFVGPWVIGGGYTVRGARAPLINEKTGEKTYDYFGKMEGFGTKGQEGPQTLFADGSVRVLNPKIDPLVFRALCTMHGKETVDMAETGKPLDKFATQDFDPFKNEEEITIKVVRRIGDGGGDDDDDDGKSDNDDSSEGSGSDDDNDSDSDSE